MAILLHVYFGWGDNIYQLARNPNECLLTFFLNVFDLFNYWYILIKLGNYSSNQFTIYDGYIVTIIPAANYLAMFLFYLIWKHHFFACISAS